jgi:hypothetical protein
MPCHYFNSVKLQNQCLWLQQWQSLAQNPPNLNFVEAFPENDKLKHHERLRKAESLLAIQLGLGTNGQDIFSSTPGSLCVFPPLKLLQRTTNSKTRHYLLL